MKKMIYSIYSKIDKDSNLFTASTPDEAMDVAFQTIFDSEEFDEFFDDDGKLHFSAENKAYFYDVLKEWTLYCVGSYDSENMVILTVKSEKMNIVDFLNSFNDKAVKK